MQSRSYRTALSASLFLVVSFTAANAQKPRVNRRVSTISANVLLRIMRAEDARRWDKDLASLLTDKSASVRKRAALAAGRIGDQRAVPALVELLKTESDTDVRQMIAFALGEIESPAGADALIEVLNDTLASGEVRARSVEALGKIAAALPKTEEARRLSIGQIILNALAAERRAGATTESNVRDREFELLGLTAVLRARPADAGKVVTSFLSSADPRIRADAANTLARLRTKDGVEDLRQLLVTDQSPDVRANAARALGAAEDKQAFDALLERTLHDDDLRVRVSAIRALASLKDARAADPLIKRGNSLFSSRRWNPAAQNELLEIVTTLGRLLTNSMNADAIDFLRDMHAMTKGEAVEVEVAFARIAPGIYLTNPTLDKVLIVGSTWRQISRRAQALAAFREVITGAATGSAGYEVLKAAQKELASMLDSRTTPALAIPDLLQAYSSYKAADADRYARKFLQPRDVNARAAAAELLGELPPSEAYAHALVSALPRALQDKDSNDAAIAILGALAKQKTKEANDAIKTALDSSDHLIRRRAVALLKANGIGDFSDRIGTVRTRNTDADYRRAIARIGKRVTATLVTSKGSFTIEFLTEDAPLTVDNFVQLARTGYLNGIAFHRVVPNFVIQGGDPRGDGNGGPGYQIRCEINEVSYDRAAVGMALSGKDTGGSQWFVTHSPQPHLDGGYTVFGRVIRGMDVVDSIARGDVIRRAIVSER